MSGWYPYSRELSLLYGALWLIPWLYLLFWLAFALFEQPAPVLRKDVPYVEGVLMLAFGEPTPCPSCAALNYPENTCCWQCEEDLPHGDSD
ncbi:MAG: hypothetical protein NWE79_00730 [Candidatus Bathyarchaeota archaeon]|nr:hypothetical protein [Candidatus Bathyarchaeota archaeon]